MELLTIGNKKWAVGLEWEILPGDGTVAQEAKDVAEKTGLKYGVLVDYDSNFSIGLTQKNTKLPSAALYLALANQDFRENNADTTDYPDWVVIEDVGDDKYWMGVIKSGLPSPQYDVLLSLAEVKEKITELLINDTYTIYSPSSEIISLFDGVKNITKDGLTELTKNVKTKLKLEKKIGIPNSVMIVGGVIVTLGLAGYIGSYFIEELDLKKHAEKRRNEQRQEAERKRVEYEAELKKYEEEKEKAKENAIKSIFTGVGGNSNEIIKTWYAAIGDMRMGTHGWDLKKVECYFTRDQQAPKFACDYLFSKGGLASNRMLLQDYPTAKIVGNDAVVTEDISIAPEYLKFPTSFEEAKLKDSYQWSLDILSQLQLLKIIGIDYNLGTSAEVSYQVPGKPLSPDEKAAGKPANPAKTGQTGVSKGALKIKGGNFELMKELASNLDLTGIGLEKVVFQIKGIGVVEWEAYMSYFVANNTGEMAGSSNEGLSATAIEEKADPNMPPRNNSVQKPQVNVPR